MSNLERRFLDLDHFELRVEGEGDEAKFKGHAAVFNSRSVDLGGFVEEIEPGFFDSVLAQDVRGLFNHEPNFILGRTGSGTMRIAQDARGLTFEIDHPGTTVANDLERSIRRGDVTGASFAFTVRRGFSEFRELEDGTLLRVLKKGGAKRLFDVGPVTFPAYEATDASVAQRSLDAWKDKSQRDEGEEQDSGDESEGNGDGDDEETAAAADESDAETLSVDHEHNTRTQRNAEKKVG